MSWFRDLDALRASGQSQAFVDTRADEAHFLNGDRLPFVVATPVEIEIP